MQKLVVKENGSQDVYESWQYDADERQYVTSTGKEFPVEIRNGHMGWDIVASEKIEDKQIVLDYSEERVDAKSFIGIINSLKKAGKKYTAYFFARRNQGALNEWCCSLWLGDWTDKPVYSGYGLTRTKNKEEALKVLKKLGSAEQIRGFWDESLRGFETYIPPFSGASYLPKEGIVQF